MASRQEDLREAFGYQFAAWRSPDGVSEHTGFEEEPEVEVDEALVDEALLDTLRIFDEVQSLVRNPSALLAVEDPCTDDYSEDSKP